MVNCYQATSKIGFTNIYCSSYYFMKYQLRQLHKWKKSKQLLQMQDGSAKMLAFVGMISQESEK